MLQNVKGLRTVRAAKPWPSCRPPRHPPPAPGLGAEERFGRTHRGNCNLSDEFHGSVLEIFSINVIKQVQVKGAFPCTTAASAERGHGWETKELADVCAPTTAAAAGRLRLSRLLALAELN